MEKSLGNSDINIRGQFTTKLGVLATAAGSAVGLGNIWRFPYEAGVHGGGVFLFCYVCFSLLLGIPLLCAEFMLGRGTRRNVCGAYRTLAPKTHWYLAGLLGVIGSVLILGFYCVVAGWTLEYFVQSFTGSLQMVLNNDYHAHFDEFSSGTWRPLMWVVVYVAINFFILLNGVKGIEKVCNWLMPILFVILVLFCVNSLTLDKAQEGLAFLFSPDFSQFNAPTVLAALGQSFFSLSIGIGCLVTYGSYFSDSTRLVKTSITTTGFDMAVAMLAAIIIFPAVFSFGGTVSAGPTLVFEVLPDIFHRLPLGAVWSALFFFLLFLASLTSTISLHEIGIAFLTDERKWSRKKATLLNCGLVLVLAVLCSLSFGVLSDVKIFGKTFFNLLDYMASNILMPLGGLLLSIFVGWVVKKSYVKAQLTNDGSVKSKLVKPVMFLIQYVAPLAILLVFLNAMNII